MDYDIARTVKVQGKTIGECLECLRAHADRYGATYKATFGINNKEFIISPNSRQPKGEPIYVPFMWRHEYREYDNSH
jgi:hypothetical protein